MTDSTHDAKMDALTQWDDTFRRFLSLDELKTLYRLLEHEYIHPDDEAGRVVVAKIRSIIRSPE